MAGDIVPITQANWDAVVGAASGPVLVWFETDWCSHCQRVKPILERLAASYTGKAIVCSVDGDANRELCHQWMVRGYPTVISFSHGRRMESKEGEQDHLIYASMIERILAHPNLGAYSTLERTEGVNWPWNADQTAAVNSFTLTPYRGGLARLIFAFGDDGDPHLTLTNAQGQSRTMRWSDLPDHLPHDTDTKGEGK